MECVRTLNVFHIQLPTDVCPDNRTLDHEICMQEHVVITTTTVFLEVVPVMYVVAKEIQKMFVVCLAIVSWVMKAMVTQISHQSTVVKMVQTVSMDV